MKKRPAQPSNKHFWMEQTTTASPQAIWKQWASVSTWKAWDTGLKNAYLEGAFELGAKGHILTLQNQKIPFEITSYEEGKQFTYTTKLPLGRLVVAHYFIPNAPVTTFVHEVWFEGFSAPFFALLLGGNFRKMLGAVLITLQQIAEQDDNT